ncbi:MAG: S8 family peptidase [Eubacterium sp.]|nr:S8 family peptidase [Eubacterium sp.]
MNNLLQLKGRFEQKKAPKPTIIYNIPAGKEVNTSHLNKLKEDLIKVRDYWQDDSEKVLNNPLVSIKYNRIIAKSNRVKKLLMPSINQESVIVGARFEGENIKKHIITHCISIAVIEKSIEVLEKCIKIVNESYAGRITKDNIDKINRNKKLWKRKDIARTTFTGVISDAYYVEGFFVDLDKPSCEGDVIITIYETGQKTQEILEKLKINFRPENIIDNTTIFLKQEEYDIIKTKAPYLISMSVSDISELKFDDFDFDAEKTISIPSPNNEPVIGVIDTLFDENVYFSEWVKKERRIPEEIPTSSDDYNHGTAVTSIIVDGPSFNPQLEDGCGRFRVRHFEVATKGKNSSFSIMREIKKIVQENRDIKVWNLSLGSENEINPNFVSPEAYILDQIQYENDVIFIVAGTNKNGKDKEIKKIGAPADSINSLVVNSVDFNNKPASYSRRGPVLSFFNKPDVSYYGGDKGSAIRTCTGTGERLVVGTSFAAPWITRKVAYLIHKIGFSREIAKALIIDSATGWEKIDDPSYIVGYGVVPRNIRDIINSDDDEIKFVISGKSEEYNTYNHSIPVPKNNNRHPYFVKVTLCYFPKCVRNQGVDYTATEFDLHFGKLKDGKISPINGNVQSVEGLYYLSEANARKEYRKWDNVKQISETIKKKSPGKTVCNNGLWGLEIKTKERLKKKYGGGIAFGIVITLKEINGVNRIEDFIYQCSFNNWIVNRIDIENRIDVYATAEEEIEFEE